MIAEGLIFRLLIVLLAFSPVITSLLTWNLDGTLDRTQYAIRHHSYPVLLVEFCTVLVAIFSGLKPTRILTDLSRWQRAAIVVTTLAALLSANSVGLYQREAWLATAVWGVHLMFGFSIWFLVQKSESSLSSFIWKIFIAGALGYIAISAAFVYIMPNPQTFPWTLRMPGVTNIRHTGYFVAPAMAAATALIFISNSTIQRTLAIFSLFVCGCFACWSGSRGVFFALLLASVVAPALPAFRRLRTWMLVLTTLAASGCTSILLYTPTPELGLLSRMQQTLNQNSSNFERGRTLVWAETIRAIKLRPLFGYGAGQFRNTMHAKVGPYNHPHNIGLMVVFQWGFVGAIGFLALVAIGFKKCLDATKDRVSNAPSLAALTTLLAHSLIDGTGYYPLPVSMMLIAGALILASVPRRN